MTTRRRLLLLAPSLLLAFACDNSVKTALPPSEAAAPPASRLWAVPDGAAALTAPQAAGFSAGTLYVNAHTAANPGGEIRGQLDHVGTVKLAQLSGAQETPATTSTAFGAGVMVVDEGTGAVSGFVVTSGLVGATAAHVHLSTGRGVAGGIIVPMTGGPDLWVIPDGTAPLDAGQITAFQGGNLYFNVHTTANPGGEIRGQIDHAGTLALASLDGAQETPATASAGHGYGLMLVNGNSGAVAGFVRSADLVNATAAHAHLSSGRGVAGGVIVPMTGGPDLWVIPDGAAALTAPQLTGFAAGQLYFNVHTPANPGGEIRGQVDHLGVARVAILSGAQETPAVTTGAYGASVVAVDAGPGSVAGFIHAFGLVQASAAHIHLSSGRGVAGSVIVPMAP